MNDLPEQCPKCGNDGDKRPFTSGRFDGRDCDCCGWPRQFDYILLLESELQDAKTNAAKIGRAFHDVYDEIGADPIVKAEFNKVYHLIQMYNGEENG